MIKKTLLTSFTFIIFLLLLNILSLSLNTVYIFDALKTEFNIKMLINVMNQEDEDNPEPPMSQETLFIVSIVLAIFFVLSIIIIIFAKIKKKDGVIIATLFIPLAVIMLIYNTCLWMSGYGSSPFYSLTLILFIIFAFIGGCGGRFLLDDIGRRSASKSGSVIIEKKCTRCGKSVPTHMKAGDRCPHCGVRWDAETYEYKNI